MIGLSTSAGLMIAFMSMASIAPTEPTWSRLDGFDQNLSFELPCASEEMIITEEGDLRLGGITREATCRMSGMGFRIILAEFSVDGSELSHFDDFSKRLFADRDEEATPFDFLVPGHRTVADRGQVNNLFGQRALLEVSQSKIAILMAGGDPAVGLDLGTQQSMTDHFFNSVRVKP